MDQKGTAEQDSRVTPVEIVKWRYVLFISKFISHLSQLLSLLSDLKWYPEAMSNLHGECQFQMACLSLAGGFRWFAACSNANQRE